LFRQGVVTKAWIRDAAADHADAHSGSANCPAIRASRSHAAQHVTLENVRTRTVLPNSRMTHAGQWV
jgi:hypothetical protein